MINAFPIAKKTAALPISFASFARSWCLNEILSTVASIALFRSSTKGIMMMLEIRSAFWVTVSPIKKPISIRMIERKSSWRIAASFL